MPRRFCRSCGAEAHLYGDGKDVCRACFPGRTRTSAPQRFSPCAGCGRHVEAKERVQIGGAERLYCAACAGPARAAAQERMAAQRSGGKKRKATESRACPKSPNGAHYYPDLRQTYDAQHRCGDTGTCAFCGVTRFWLRPGQEATSHWRLGLKLNVA